MTQSRAIWRTALLAPPHADLSYQVPHGLPEECLTPGQRVLVPLGAKNILRAAVLLVPAEAGELPPDMVCKPMVWPMDREPLLSADYLEMIRQLALRQLETVGSVLAHVLPAGLRNTRVAYEILDGGRKRMAARDMKQLAPAESERLGRLWLERSMRCLRPAAGQSEDVYCFLAKDPPWAVRPAASQQIAVLEYLHERGAVTRRWLLKDLGAQAARPLDILAERGLVRLGPPPGDMDEDETLAACLGDEPVPERFDLTPEQSVAFLDLLGALEEGKRQGRGQVRMLYGVTGSGKTAVYLELARRCLESGRSVLLLAPEVALACQLQRVAKRMLAGHEVLFHHGYQPASRREKAFLGLVTERRPVCVVGTRSALFLPVHNPGLVILDEEHDSSFKQEERLNYQAKEVGWFLANQAGGVLLLGSATPDVKSFHASREGRLPTLVMKKRLGAGGQPGVRLVDIRQMGPTDQLVAPSSMEALRETVQRGDQAILMLNRRGYAPLMYCLDCGTVAKCPNCEIGLTYHKGRERLVCHYCGEAASFPLNCAKCGGNHYLPMGEGTEKIEESLEAELPEGVGVLRLDRDSTRRPGRMEEILDAFARQEAQVLVGTQMLSKGHHFPNVTLVVVADGDLGLNLPDYRAAERTFQLLVQVAGRAGRGDKPGEVLIQTRDPRHYCWEFVQAGDYEGFFERELEVRRKRRYPPFIKLALIRLDYPLDWDKGSEVLAEAGKLLREHGRRLGVTVLGPAPAPLGLLRGRKRFHCLLKSETWPPVRELFGQTRKALGSTQLRLHLDLDPVNML